MLSSSPSKITNHSSPACPRDPRTSDSARKLRNTSGPVGARNQRTVADLLLRQSQTTRHDPLVVLRLIYVMFSKLLSVACRNCVYGRWCETMNHVGCCTADPA